MPSARRLLSKRPILFLLTLSLLAGGLATGAARPARADKRPGCNKEVKHRTAEETIRQHIAFLQAGDLEQALCDYAEDAVVVLPGQIVRGVDAIRGGLGGIGALLGGAVPQLQTLTATSSVVLITFTAFGTPCTIPDGSDTYIVEKGLIVTQTVHDTFRSAPGATCPAAPPGT